MASEIPDDENSKANRTEGPAYEHGRHSKPPVPPFPTILQPPPAATSDDPSNTKHRDWLDYTIFGAEIFGLAVLIAYTTFAALQWCETKKAADAAKSAAETASATLRLTFQPRISLLGISPTVQSYVNGKLETKLDHGRLTVRINAPNTGPFPATNVRFFSYDNVSTREQVKKLPYRELPGEPKLVPPKAEGGWNSEMTITGDKVITATELDGLKAGTLWATFSILISYDDQFGSTHYTEYCDLFNLTPYNDICPWLVRNDVVSKDNQQQQTHQQ